MIAALANQPAFVLQMIDHDRPVVNADGHVGYSFPGSGARGQMLDATREVVAKVADRAAAKGQLTGERGIDVQMALQQRKRIIARQ